MKRRVRINIKIFIKGQATWLHRKSPKGGITKYMLDVRDHINTTQLFFGYNSSLFFELL
jgi:hypothetical protein